MKMQTVVAVGIVIAIAIVVVLAVAWKNKKSKRDDFLDKIGDAFKKAGQFVVKTGLTIKDGAVAGYNSVTGKGQDAAQQVVAGPPPYAPTFSGRQFDKYDWSCPWWTVESGNADNSKACYNRPYTSPVWRDTGGGKWGWSCPNGTTPNNDPQWEKQCAVGYMGRVYTDEGWKCPQGTTDTGKTWENSDWYEAQRQCERGGPYTTRVSLNKKWVCPPGSKDTGLSWGSETSDDPDRGYKQCKWTGP